MFKIRAKIVVGLALLHWPGCRGYNLHRRETLFRIAETARTAIAGKELRGGSAGYSSPPFSLGDVAPFSNNAFGSFLVGGMCNLCYAIGASASEHSLARIRIRLVLAAEKWRRAHDGKNPPSLDVLVPYYLASVPKDPWSKSGEPIKYDATHGVAWSVGKDGTYDYRKIAKDHAAGSKASVDVGTQEYAFRLDGKPINNEGTPECDVEPEVQPKEKLRKEENPPADVRRRHWLVPIASCRAAMKYRYYRYDSRMFISGIEQSFTEGAVISPSRDKCGYRVLRISDRCVWFEAFYGDEPPKDKLPHVTWPDFSRIDTISPTPPPGCLMLGKRKFWLGDAIKLPSGFYLMVDDFLDGKAAVFRLLDSGMRPVRDLLCVIVREEK